MNKVTRLIACGSATLSMFLTILADFYLGDGTLFGLAMVSWMIGLLFAITLCLAAVADRRPKMLRWAVLPLLCGLALSSLSAASGAPSRVGFALAEPGLRRIADSTPSFRKYSDGQSDRWAFPYHVSWAHKDNQGTFLSVALYPDSPQEYLWGSECGFLLADPGQLARFKDDPESGALDLEHIKGDWYRVCF